MFLNFFEIFQILNCFLNFPNFFQIYKKKESNFFYKFKIFKTFKISMYFAKHLWYFVL